MVAPGMIRTGAACALAVGALGMAGCARADGVDAGARSCEDLQIELLATAQIPANVQGLGRVGGLSGVAFFGGSSRGIVVSDRGERPAAYEFELSLECGDVGDAAGAGAWSVRFDLVREIRMTHPAQDLEAVAMLGEGHRERWVLGYERPVWVGWCGEGLQGVGFPLPREAVEGFRENRGIESVAVRGVGEGEFEVWAGMEAALVGDGDEATQEAGTLCRVLVFDGGGGLSRQVLYETEARPAGLAGTFAINSLAEMCALPNGRVLALERSFALPRGYGAEVFVVDGRVEAREGLALPVLVKDRVADLREMGLLVMGNLEGMAVGPRVADLVGDESERGRVLLLVADDNFGRDGQAGSQVVVVRVSGGG